jgi:hypothetical protein
MTISIEATIHGISQIPQAMWIDTDPSNPPVIRPRLPPSTVLVGHTPVFDDSGFVAPSSPRWQEAVTAVNRRVSHSFGSSMSNGPAGADAVAWYVSFHGSSDRWGIYIPLSSLPILDELYFAHLPVPRAERWRLVWDTLVAHEAAHFAVDLACAWFELLHHAPLRRPVRDRMRASSDWSNVLLPHSSYFEAEEAFANGHVLRAMRQNSVPGITDALLGFIRAQPPGYRDGERAATDFGFVAAATEVLRGYLSVWSSLWNLDPGHPALDLSRLLPLAPDELAQCPVWVLNDLDEVGLSASAVQMFARVAPIVESPDFRKMLKRKKLGDAWERTKVRLAGGIPNGIDFKKWPKDGDGMWSVRVTDGVRAHLRQPSVLAMEDCYKSQWIACRIGHHKEMGHG